MGNKGAENEYVIIPNPIYDVVFRYLMEDNESAIIIISTLINERIKKLRLEPSTHPEKRSKLKTYEIRDPKTSDDVALFHLDFTATVELPDGKEELIMIELQKASEPSDIFRFKRYISKNFQHKQTKEVTDLKTQAIKTVELPVRLIPIFILNFRIENEINDLLIRTQRLKSGVFKDKPLKQHNDFIDNLSYDLWVIQLPNLSKISPSEYADGGYKEKLYVLLKLFDQQSKVKDNDHRLRLIRKFFPGFLDRVINRLQAADSENPDLEEQMYVEDEYLKALIDRDNRITELEEEVDKRGKVLEEQNKVLEEKDKVLEEQNKVLEEQNKALEAKEQVIYDLAILLKRSGVSAKEISEKTGLTLDVIESL